MSIFDPNVIARIEQLELRARQVVEGFMVGVHRSPYRGISTDFAEHRLYAQGDDTRHLDWKIYARVDRFYVKKFEQDTNLEARFLVDCSRSMFFQSDGAALSKFDYAATLTASLAYLLHKQRDAVGLTLFDSDLRTTLPPRATYTNFRHLIATLEKASPGADTGLGSALRKIGLQSQRRGLVVVVSDFVDDLEYLGEALSLHTGKGNEVLLFRIEDPEEESFPYRGPTVFLGMEKEGKLLCDPRDLRSAYLAARQKHVQRLAELGRQHGCLIEEAPTHAPLDSLLAGFLDIRRELLRR
jgi:uncharacterized protein (DUF58 family)